MDVLLLLGVQVDFQRFPPRLDSRAEFSVWLCEQHNIVNEMLGGWGEESGHTVG